MGGKEWGAVTSQAGLPLLSSSTMGLPPVRSERTPLPLTWFVGAQELEQEPADAPERGGGQRVQQQQRAQRVDPI